MFLKRLHLIVRLCSTTISFPSSWASQEAARVGDPDEVPRLLEVLDGVPVAAVQNLVVLLVAAVSKGHPGIN